MLNLKNINFAIKKDGEKINLIKDANLKIGKGSFVAVVGPSGCGKTTLLKIIAGINEQNKGQSLGIIEIYQKKISVLLN